MHTHILELATWRGFDEYENLHFRASTPASIIALPTMLPMPNMQTWYIADLLVSLVSSLFDTLVTDIPYSDVAAGTSSYAAICFRSARFW